MRPNDELRQVERAAALKAGARAATLQRRGDAMVFAYDPDYLAGGGLPVALWIDGVEGLHFDVRILHKLRRAIEYRRERLVMR